MTLLRVPVVVRVAITVDGPVGPQFSLTDYDVSWIQEGELLLELKPPTRESPKTSQEASK